MEFIELEHLSRIYTKGDQRINALDDLTMSVPEGIFLSVVGRSGSGKSTLLNLVGGLDTPTGGKIFFRGEDISRLTDIDRARHRRKNVGMIFQSFNLIHSYKAYENIMLSLIFGGVPKKLRKAKAFELLESVGLRDRAFHTPDELSGGETQRVAIARALSNSPDILLADEPTGNLDSFTAGEIIDLMMNLNRKNKKTVIMITHDLELANRISDRVIRLLDGRIIEDFYPARL